MDQTEKNVLAFLEVMTREASPHAMVSLSLAYHLIRLELAAFLRSERISAEHDESHVPYSERQLHYMRLMTGSSEKDKA